MTRDRRLDANEKIAIDRMFRALSQENTSVTQKVRDKSRTLHAIECTGKEIAERSMFPIASLKDIMRFVSSISSRASLRFIFASAFVLPSDITFGISSIHVVYPPCTF